jgi:hypothetical protein
MVTKLVSITSWSTYIWIAIESISMTSGPESMKGLCGGVILFGKALLLEMAPLDALKPPS